MHIIEPCCVQRQLDELRKSIGMNGRDEIRGYGDMSLTELLPALLTSYNDTEMLIAAPAIPDQAAEIVNTWLNWKWARMDGNGTISVLRRVTIVSDLSSGASPMASGWIKENAFGGRLVLVDSAQDDTALLLPDIAITGPLNLRYGRNFTCGVTTVQEEVASLWKRYARVIRVARKVAAKQQHTGREVDLVATKQQHTGREVDLVAAKQQHTGREMEMVDAKQQHTEQNPN